MEDIVVNGKIYPMWQQFVQKKDEWIGGVLQDRDNDPFLGGVTIGPTVITDVVLRENGKDSAWFEFSGKDYSCGFDVKYGGIGGNQPGNDVLRIQGYGSMAFDVSKPKK